MYINSYRLVHDDQLYSTLLQGGGSSPFGGRSTSPIDISSITGSPHHSPNAHCNPLPGMGSLESAGSITGGGTNGYSAGTYGSGGSPGYSSDMMISAGGIGRSTGSTTQMDLGLSKEFQRFTVVSFPLWAKYLYNVV